METQKTFITLLTATIIVIAFIGCAPIRYTQQPGTDTGLKKGPRVAAVGDTYGAVYLVWGGQGVQFSKGNMGKALSTPVTVLPSTMSSPEIAAVGSNVYISTTNTQSKVTFTASNDYGANFKTPISMSNPDYSAGSSQLAAYGDYVFIIYLEKVPDEPYPRIYLKASSDAGQTFSDPGFIGYATNTPKIGVANENLCIAWINQDFALHFVSYAGGGEQVISERAMEVELLANGNNVYIAWSAPSSGTGSVPDIFIKRSGDKGASFASRINISNTSGKSMKPKLSSSGERVYAVWEDNTSGIENIYYSYSANNTSGFSTAKNLSYSSTIPSWNPRIAASGSYVHIVYQQHFGGDNNWEIEYDRSDDAGQTFTTHFNNPDGRPYALADTDPEIVVRGVDRYIPWIRVKEGIDNWQVMFFSSTSCPKNPKEDGKYRCISKPNY